jgi:ribosomal protein L24E
MKTKFARCEFCSEEISDICKLARVRTIVDGKEHVFCCAKCAKQYREKKKAR